MVCFARVKKTSVIFAIVLLLISFSGCKSMYPSEWGERLEYEDSELFYTPSVGEGEARRLGDYLLENGFFRKGNSGTAQITKDGDVYQFRVVVKEGAGEDMEYLKIAGMFAAQLSMYVFDGEIVEMHLCDKGLKTQQVVGFQIEESEEIE